MKQAGIYVNDVFCGTLREDEGCLLRSTGQTKKCLRCCQIRNRLPLSGRLVPTAW